MFPLLLILFVYGCRPDADLPEDGLAYIPEQVTSVTVVDLDRLMEKADFEQVKTMDFYRDVVGKVQQENPAFARIMQAPAEAGVDLAQKVYISMELNAPQEQGFVALVFSIADQHKFEQTLDDLELKYLPAGQKPGLLQHKRSALVWNEQIAILGVGSEEQVEARASQYLQTDQAHSVANNKNLRKALKRDFEVLNWISSSGLVDLFKLEDVGKAARFNAADLRENYLQSFLRFEDGEMVAESEIFLQPKLAGDLALLLNDKVATDFSKRIPQEDIVFYANAGLRPKGFNQILLEYHIKGMSDQPLEKFGIKFDDLMEAFSGDAALAMYLPEGDTMNMPHFLLALDIDGKEDLTKVLDGAQQAAILRPTVADRYQLLSPPGKDSLGAAIVQRVEGEILIKNGLLYLSDRAALLDKVQSGNFATQGKLMESMPALIAKRALAGILDMARVSQLEDDFTNSPITSVEGNAGRKEAMVRVKMQEEGTNSLKQFFQWMNRQYQEQQLKKQGTEDSKS